MPRQGEHYGVPVTQGLTPATSGYKPSGNAVPAVHSFTPYAPEAVHQCEGTMAKTGVRCSNPTPDGEQLCFGHKRGTKKES